ncbi:MAG: hypothetical protein AB1649_32330, partial [Chloroflexota bacterium]
ISLVPYLKHGGQIVIDVYYRAPWLYLTDAKYWLRPLTKRLPPKVLYHLVNVLVPVVLPVKVNIQRLPVIGPRFSGYIPVANYKGKYPLSEEQLLEWSILDTFDMLSAWYDQPQRLDEVLDWFDEAGLIDVYVGFGPNGINGRGTRP